MPFNKEATKTPEVGVVVVVATGVVVVVVVVVALIYFRDRVFA